MIVEEITSVLLSQTIEESKKYIHTDRDDIIRMLKDLKYGKKTPENWFLDKAIEYIAEEEFDISGYCISHYVTNQESDPDASVNSWLITFYKADFKECGYKEFKIEVELGRLPPAMAWKWIERRRGRAYPRPVKHISLRSICGKQN